MNEDDKRTLRDAANAVGEFAQAAEGMRNGTLDEMPGEEERVEMRKLAKRLAEMAAREGGKLEPALRDLRVAASGSAHTPQAVDEVFDAAAAVVDAAIAEGFIERGGERLPHGTT